MSFFRRPASLGLLATVLMGTTALAHPLGNSSITHFNVIYVLPDRVEVDFLLDIAEGPSEPIRQNEIDADKDGHDTDAEQKAWLEKKAVEFAPFLKTSLDGEAITLSPASEARDPVTGEVSPNSRVVMKIPGFGGMPTYRLLIRYVGKFPKPLRPGTEHVLEYADQTYPQHSGLKRILLEKIPQVEFIKPPISFYGEGPDPFLYEQYDPGNLPDERETKLRFKVLATGTAPAGGEPVAESQPAAVVSNTPATAPAVAGGDATTDGPAVASGETDGRVTTSAPAVASTSDPAPPPSASAGDGAAMPRHLESLMDPRNDPARASEYYRQASELVTRLQGPWGLTMLLSVTVLAFGWGAAHALMPGHAKTVVAAYLISQRGTYWHAVLLAIIVTVTHTALVVIMGVIIWAYQSTHPTLSGRLQLWLGAIAGILVAIMGVTLIWRAVTGRIVHHHHDHDHHHDHAEMSWLRRLFTHSHPHVPALAHHGADHSHGHEHSPDVVAGHGHRHSHSHDHAHGHDHGHSHSHSHAHSHDHGQAHHHSHPHSHNHRHSHDHGHSHSHDHSHSHSHDHGHAHGHPHSHGHAHDHAHSHGHGHHHHHHHHHHPAEAEPISTRMLLMLGITGGIVPCPTATIIMLLGIGANVVLGALYAVGVFSLGLALTLMLIGFLALSSRKFAARVLPDAQHEGELSGGGQKLMFQVIPAISGAVVVALGVAIAANYFYMMRTGTALVPWLG